MGLTPRLWPGRVGDLAAAVALHWPFRASRHGTRESLTKPLVVATRHSSPIPQPQSTNKQ